MQIPSLTALIWAALLMLFCLAPTNAAVPTGQSQVSWVFTLRHDPDLTPHSNVFLRVSGRRILILRDADSAFTVLNRTDYHDHDVPRQAIAACTSWFAGQGEDLYVIRRSGRLIVFSRALDEQAGPFPYKRLKVVSLR